MPSDPTPGSPGSSTNPSGNHAARFIAQFARRPTLMRRGVLPGTRVWATTAGAAALVVVGVLVVPLLARMDLFSGSTSVRSAAAGGSDTAVSTDGRLAPSPQASRGTGSGSPRSGAAAAGGSGSGIAGLPAVGGGAAGQQSGPDTAGLAASGGGTSGQQSGSGTKNQSGGAAQSGSSSSTTTTSSSGSSTSGTTSAPGVRLLGSESHRCIDVTDDSAKDGTSLQIWTCNTQADQKWLFASDGTVRSMGLCMDVAGGSTRNGAVIQLANCHHDGNGAQQFVLSSAGDLVNRQADKCVDVVNQGTSAGTGLLLWTCNGQPNQKWHKA